MQNMEKRCGRAGYNEKTYQQPRFHFRSQCYNKTGLDITNPEHATIRKDGIMGRYYRLSKKLTEDESREVQREMREIADVEDVSIKADERMLFVVTKDGQFSDVMSRAVNICSRVANGAELSFARFAEA